MVEGDCKDKIRFSLSDQSGVLRFESFEIVDQPECRRFLDELRGVLLGRPLAEIDLAELRRFSCPHGNHCTRAVMNVIEDCQNTFVRRK